VVVSHKGQQLSIWEFTDHNLYEVRQNSVTTLRDPAVREYRDYIFQQCLQRREEMDYSHRGDPKEPLDEQMRRHEAVVVALEAIAAADDGDDRLLRARQSALELEREKLARCVATRRARHRRFRTDYNDDDDEEVLEDEKEAGNGAGLVEEVPEEEGLRAVRDVADNAEEVTEESDEDSDEDSDDDEEDSDEDEEDEDDSSSSSEEDDYEGVKIDVKVAVLLLPPSQQEQQQPQQLITRGFPRTPLTTEGLQEIISALGGDYQGLFSMFFRDEDDEEVQVLSGRDFLYVVRRCKRLQRCKKLKDIRVKLCARQVAALPAIAKQPQTRESTNDFKQSQSRLTSNAGQFNGNNNNNYYNNNDHNQNNYNYSYTVNTHSSNINSGSSLHSNNSTMLGTGGSLGEVGNKESSGVVEIAAATAAVVAVDGFSIVWKRGDVLGCGSFGKVYSGIDLSSGERMAVKEVELQRTRHGRDQVKALQREVQILSRLVHPNIIRYLGTECSSDDHTLRIFLELATDGSLKDTSQQFGAFPEPLIQRYGLDIVRGLSYLHGQKMIHRDIKPANLLLSRGVVKLADFGCSSSFLNPENGYVLCLLFAGIFDESDI
jgi:hypothetical protein